MRFYQFLEIVEQYPNLTWVRNQLRYNAASHNRYKVLGAFIIGSEAKGSATPQSDLDIAVIIPPIRGKTALQVSEYYHTKFRTDWQKPHWNGRIVDFQFFYPDDPMLANYPKIQIG
jgi:predicted nucleotidyltransferase